MTFFEACANGWCRSDNTTWFYTDDVEALDQTLKSHQLAAAQARLDGLPGPALISVDSRLSAVVSPACRQSKSLSKSPRLTTDFDRRLPIDDCF